MSDFEQKNSKAPGGDNESILRDISNAVKSTAVSAAATATSVSNIENNSETNNNYNSTTSVDTTAISAVLGTTAGASIIKDDDGTIQQYIRGLVSLISAGALMSKLDELLVEQRKTNIYLQLITDEEVRESDVKE